jgi:hypothetical protein
LQQFWNWFLYNNIVLGKKAANLWLGMSKAGTLYFEKWVNGEPLTYNGFVAGYNWKSWTTEHCASFEYEMQFKYALNAMQYL